MFSRFFGGRFDGGGRDGYTDDNGNPNFQNMAEKSAAATRREEQAIVKFKQAREQMEKRNDVQPGSKQTVELLKPSCHLVEACWQSFRKHVLSHNGWLAKRRVATEQEKKNHGEKRKGKVYFVDVIFSVPQLNVPKPKVKTPKKRSLEEDKKVPPITSFFEAKKLKKGSVEEAEGKSEAGSSAMSSDTQDDA